MAYRKGDIPKVKLDIPNAPKFDLGDLTEPMSNMDRLFDNIAKDIRERQDNAIAMEFTKCIGELLKKNGVTPKITKYTHENVKEHSIEQLYGVSIDELDFSEHDKVFEDKIVTLEEELKEWIAEAREIKKNRAEQLKSVRKAVEPYVDIGHMHETIAELKQRIAELESKESVKPMRIEFHADNGEMLTPLEIANSLINQNTFKVDELRELAEHLQVYCRHHNDRDTETISF